MFVQYKPNESYIMLSKVSRMHNIRTLISKKRRKEEPKEGYKMLSEVK